MRRRTFLKSIGGTAAAISLARISPSAPAARRPNILFIMTDQQFAEAMSCRIGKRYINTPGMDSLAETGMVFTRAYCANPICVPSRTSLFTGRYPVETGVQKNDDVKRPLKNFPCLGTVFEQAGYDTGYVGKWHLPFPSKDRTTHGFENLAGSPDEVKPGLAIEFLRRKRDKPFLLVLSLMNPHNICQWARGEDLPDGAIGPPPPLDQCPPLLPNHEPPKNETAIMSLMRRSYQSSKTFPVSGFDDKKWREYVWAYYRMLELVDGHMNKVLGALRESGQEENTLVVFTSDHGDCQGAHKWNQKTVFYDEASRVPFIISYKGMTKRGTSDRLVHTGVDLIPTLCDYAGIPLPAGLPGLSLKDTADGQAARDPRKFIVVSNHLAQGAPIDGVTPAPTGRMVRSQRYKYCVYSEGRQWESLFDMEKDPGEMVNLAGSGQHREILAQHRRYLADWGRKLKDSFPVPGQS